MREWLSGGAPPCQGGGRGFDPRLALYTKEDDIDWYYPLFYVFIPFYLSLFYYPVKLLS